MKLPNVITVSVAALLSSCCCPKPVRNYTGGSAQSTGQPAEIGFPQEEGTAGSRFIIIGLQNPLPVVPRKQEGFYSCWSTSAQMIMEYLGRHVSQCEQASRPGDSQLWCCEANGQLKHHPDCDEPNYPDFERWGFDVSYAPPPSFLSWAQVTNEIDNGRPFAFSWIRNDLNTAGSQVSHMMVVVGYSQSGGPETQMLFCLNPRAFAVADEIMVPFSLYAGIGAQATAIGNTGVPGYTHLSDYFEIRLASPPSTNP